MMYRKMTESYGDVSYHYYFNYTMWVTSLFYYKEVQSQEFNNPKSHSQDITGEEPQTIFSSSKSNTFSTIGTTDTLYKT